MKQPAEERELQSQMFSENHFLNENIQGGIVYSDFDPPFHLRYATEGMSELSGYSQEELLEMTQLDLVCEDDIDTLMAEVGRQFSMGDTFTVEYQLKRKDGRLVNVLDRAKAAQHENGNKYIHCLLTDITYLKQLEQALLLSQEKYKLAIQQSGNVIVEYDLYTGTLQFSENYTDIFGSEMPDGTLWELLENDFVEKPYQELLKAMFGKLLQTKQSDSIELRVRGDAGNFLWCNLHLSAVATSTGTLYSIIGCLQNIDNHKKYVNQLIDQSERDGLTNIYNRVAMERMINEHLRKHNEGALAILDIDGFKEVNDRKGHDFGDSVLIDLARQIELILPKYAKFGRLGGDEFLIFLPWSVSSQELEAFGRSIVTQVRDNFTSCETPITVSLGLADYSDGCKCFKTLYKSADVALYSAKNNGRNCFVIASR